MNDLHAQIMNIQCQKVPAFAFASGDVGPEQLRAYKAGHRDARHAAAELALKVVAQPVQPAGWKLVPIEPTPEMLTAAHDGDRAYTLRNFGNIMTVLQGAEDHWEAMIFASPNTAQPVQPALAYGAQNIRSGKWAYIWHDIDDVKRWVNLQHYLNDENTYCIVALAQPVQPAYPVGQVVGPCVCGSWPGGECLKCPWIPAQPVQPTAWQPIETAPRTGVRVLYLSNKFGEYVGNHPPKCSPGDWYFIDGAWRGSANQQAATATHWMPLPAPPTKE